MSDVADVVVIGDGIAGTAAGFAARKAGATVIIVSEQNGATGMYSGALDEMVREKSLSCRYSETSGAADNERLSDGLLQIKKDFIEAMGLWNARDERAVVAGLWGTLRTTAGCDRTVLDLATLRDARVVVPKVNRANWNANRLCAMWTLHGWARDKRVEFSAIDAKLLQDATSEHEACISDTRFAGWLDDPEARERFADGLRDVLAVCGKADAVLLGPWLGLKENAAKWLSEQLYLPVGETLTLHGGVAGLRFETATDRVFESIGVTRKRVRALRVSKCEQGGSEGQWRIETQSEAVDARAVVVACGNVLSGGVVLRAPLVEGPGAAFSLSFQSPLELAVDGGINTRVSSLYGIDAEQFEWPKAIDDAALLDRVCVMHSGGRAIDRDGNEINGLFVAGSIAMGGRTRMIDSIHDGIRAGMQAAPKRCR